MKGRARSSFNRLRFTVRELASLLLDPCISPERRTANYWTVTTIGTLRVSVPLAAVISTDFDPVSRSVVVLPDELPPHPRMLPDAAVRIRSGKMILANFSGVRRRRRRSSNGTAERSTPQAVPAAINEDVVTSGVPEIVNVVVAVPPLAMVPLGGENSQLMPAGRPEHA